MSATLHDIADKTDLSVSTISRVLNGKAEQYRISEASKQLVLKAARELDYTPNRLARSLRLKKTLSIGLVVPDISNPFFAHVTGSIQRATHQQGYSLVVCSTDERLALEVEHIGLLRSRGIDGLIVMPVGQKHDHLKQLIDEDMPLVLLDRSFDEPNEHCVVVDNYRGAFEATEHLIKQGHTRIALIQGLPHTSTNKSRRQGYQDALRKHGLSIDERLTAGQDFRAVSGYNAAKRFFDMDNPPSALFALGDLITLGTLQAVSEAGLSIPGDLSLISFDDVDFAPYLMSPLTAVAQPKEAMGQAAVDLLMSLIEDEAATNGTAGRDGEARRVVLQPHLVVRASVAPPSAREGAAPA